MTAIASAQVGLLDITEVKPLSDEDRACFADLKDVLARHGALNRFGVSLLHSHFPVYEGEVLVEECDEEARTLTLMPRNRAELTEKTLLQTNWRLDTDEAVQQCQAYCVMTSDGHGGGAHRQIPN